MGLGIENHWIKCNKREEAEKEEKDNQPWLLKPESTR